MDQGKLALLTDKTMDVVLFLALLALIVMTVIEIHKRWKAYSRMRLQRRDELAKYLHIVKWRKK